MILFFFLGIISLYSIGCIHNGHSPASLFLSLGLLCYLSPLPHHSIQKHNFTRDEPFLISVLQLLGKSGRVSAVVLGQIIRDCKHHVCHILRTD